MLRGFLQRWHSPAEASEKGSAPKVEGRPAVDLVAGLSTLVRLGVMPNAELLRAVEVPQ